MFQGLGCSPIKVVHELGSERHETVQSISGLGVRALRGPFPSTRGPSSKVAPLLVVTMNIPCSNIFTIKSVQYNLEHENGD